MSKQLFDEEDDPIENSDIENTKNNEEEEEDFVPVRISSRDKIFDNDYNTGNLDFEEYSSLPKVDSFYAEDNLKECYDSYEYSRKLNLEIKVNDIFNQTEFGKIFANKKKLPKQILPQVFISIREQFVGNDYTESEIFTCIADYFGINYEVLYENIPSVYRAQLVKELDEKYGVLKRKGVKRLF